MLPRRRQHSTSVLYWACSVVPLCAIILSCVGFLVTRLQVFSEALNSEYQRRAQETWLRRECKKPEFYANMQLHADLCDKVEANARGNAWLIALAHLFENTYLCGYSPCAQLLDSLLDWIGAHGIPFLLVFAAISLLLPTVLVPMYRQSLVYSADAHAQASLRYQHPLSYCENFGYRGRAYPLLKDD
jgi:hypothetical protein